MFIQVKLNFCLYSEKTELKEIGEIEEAIKGVLNTAMHIIENDINISPNLMTLEFKESE